MRLKRRIQKPIHETFNDGFLTYGHNEIERNSTGKRIGEKFKGKGTLAFKLLSARDEDHLLAKSLGASLDLKVKTPFPPSFRNITLSSLKCENEKNLYDVIKVDWDGEKRYLYFYLQKVGVIGE